jgi:hypothetical protein
MFEELLPRDGVFVPSQIVYNKSLSVGLKTTWMQLRGLAGEDGETPMMAISALCEIIGKSRPTVYRHLSQLGEMGLLQWQPLGIGRLSVDFQISRFADESQNCNNLSQKRDSNSLKLNNMVQRDDLNLKAKAEIKELSISELRQPVSKTRQQPAQEQEPVAEHAVEKTPAQIYREVIHLTANRVQREEMDQLVSDLDLWRRTLKYWMLHNWNPFNVPGMLDMYRQGGPQRSRRSPGGDSGEKPLLEDQSEQRERDRVQVRKMIEEAREKRRRNEAASRQTSDSTSQRVSGSARESE